MVAHLPVGDEQDRELLLDVLLSREALGSTAIGEGIAIPHVRSPLVFAGSKGAVAVCYLESPVGFDAPDHQPVHTLFALVSSTIRGHLQLLSRLSLALLEYIILSSQLPNTHELSLPRHKAILTALQARDPLGARQATLVQLDETVDDINSVLASDGRVYLA